MKNQETRLEVHLIKWHHGTRCHHETFGSFQTVSSTRFLFNRIGSARRIFCCPPFVCGQFSAWQRPVPSHCNLPVGKKEWSPSWWPMLIHDADEEDPLRLMDLFNDDSSDEDDTKPWLLTAFKRNFSDQVGGTISHSRGSIHVCHTCWR